MNVDQFFKIAGKIVLITGGAQGLGRMIAEGFVRAGCRVYISTRHADIGVDAAKEMSAFGHCECLLDRRDGLFAAGQLAQQRGPV